MKGFEVLFTYEIEPDVPVDLIVTGNRVRGELEDVQIANRLGTPMPERAQRQLLTDARFIDGLNDRLDKLPRQQRGRWL